MEDTIIAGGIIAINMYILGILCGQRLECEKRKKTEETTLNHRVQILEQKVSQMEDAMNLVKGKKHDYTDTSAVVDSVSGDSNLQVVKEE